MVIVFNKDLNHTRKIAGNTLKLIEKRTTKLTNNKDLFDSAKHIYWNALSKINSNYKLDKNPTIDSIKLKNI